MIKYFVVYLLTCTVLLMSFASNLSLSILLLSFQYLSTGAFLEFADGGGNEARRAESGGGVLGEGAASPLPTS